MRWLQYLVLLACLSLGYYVLSDMLGLNLKDDARKSLSFIAALATLWYLSPRTERPVAPAPKPPVCLEDLERKATSRPKPGWPRRGA